MMTGTTSTSKAKAEVALERIGESGANPLYRHLGRVRRDRGFNAFDLACQGIVTTIVVLRVWKGWDFTLHAIALGAAAATYLAPALLAFRRSHPRRWLIALVVAFLGWTGVAWIMCLRQALSAQGAARDAA